MKFEYIFINNDYMILKFIGAFINYTYTLRILF
jgi:hypothetical protein